VALAPTHDHPPYVDAPYHVAPEDKVSQEAFVVIRTQCGTRELRLDGGKIELLGAEDAEVPGFDAQPLMLSASGLANHVTLPKYANVEADHRMDVG
jgi:hypothetical protein